MKIMVTGGAGFIGRYVQSRAKELGYETRVFDTAVNIMQDVTDPVAVNSYFDDFGPDRVIHLSGLLGTHELWSDTSDAIDVNIKGALNVGHWCRDNGVKMVSIEQPHIWYNVYEATKFAARRMLTGMHYDQGLQVDFITAHNAFGPGQPYGAGHPRKILPTFSTQAWAGGPIEIWGDGRQNVNLVYAGDVADALLRRADCASSRPEEQWQAGSRELYTVNDVAAYVATHVEVVYGERVSVKYVGNRLGEQNEFPYPQPTEGYDLDWAKFAATVDSYRP